MPWSKRDELGHAMEEQGSFDGVFELKGSDLLRESVAGVTSWGVPVCHEFVKYFNICAEAEVFENVVNMLLVEQESEVFASRALDQVQRACEI